MSIENSNTARRKTDADTYWIPEGQKDQASRAADVLSTTAWKPPVLDAGKGPTDKTKTGDKAKKPLELSQVYPIGELDKRAQAWMDYAALVHPTRNLNVKPGDKPPGTRPKPGDKPPGTNPYPYEPPFKPPTDYVPPQPVEPKPQGADWGQWAVGLAALGAGVFALHKTLKWLRGGEKDKEPNAQKEQELKNKDQELKTKDQELKTEEERIKQDKVKLDTDTAALKDKEKQLSDREEKAKAEETRIAEAEKKAKDFAERETVLNDKAKLNDEKTQINEERTKLAEQAKALNETRTTIAIRSQDLQTNQDQLVKDQEKLATDKAAFQKSLNGFAKETEDLRKLQEDSAKLQKDLDTAKTALDQAAEKLVKDKAELATKPDAEKEKTLAAEEKRITDERKQLDERQTKITEQTKQLANDQQTLDQAKQVLEQEAQQLKQEETRLTTEKERLTEKAKAIATEKTAAEADRKTITDNQAKLTQEKTGLDRQKGEIGAAKDLLVKEREAATKPPVPEKPPEEKPPEERPKPEKPPDEKPPTTSVEEVQQQLKDNETFNKLTNEARMTDALKQLTDRALQRMPESNEEKADFLGKQLKAAMRKQLGVSTDAELPESLRKLEIKVVDSDGKAPRIVQANPSDPAVIEIPAKLLAENPKGVLVDAYSQASGLSIANLMHEKGNAAITVRSIEPMLNKIASQAEKIIGARSLALANQEKPTISPEQAASDRPIALDPKKPIVTAWDGESLTFGGEKFHVNAEIEKLEKERDTKVKDMEEQLRKAKELAESTKKASDVEAARTLETQLLAEKQNLRVVAELKAAMAGQRGQQAQDKARTMVRDAADKAISDRLNAREGGGAPLSRGAAIAIVVTTLAFLYVGATRPARPDDYQATFTVH